MKNKPTYDKMVKGSVNKNRSREWKERLQKEKQEDKERQNKRGD